MHRSITKVVYFTNIFPSYRKELWKALLSLKKINFNIYFSDRDFLGIGATPIDSFFNETEIKKLHSIKNVIFNRHLFWQKGVLKVLFKEEYDYVIFLGDLKILTNWVGIIICRLRGKKIGFWTHGMYGNEKFFKKKLRLFF